MKHKHRVPGPKASEIIDGLWFGGTRNAVRKAYGNVDRMFLADTATTAMSRGQAILSKALRVIVASVPAQDLFDHQ